MDVKEAKQTLLDSMTAQAEIINDENSSKEALDKAYEKLNELWDAYSQFAPRKIRG